MVRISRTTQKGTTYASSFKEKPKPETREALDAVADAAMEMVEAEQKARAWVLGLDGAEWIAQHGGLITPAHLQRVHRIGFNTAARILEGLEKDGELVRIPAPVLTWALAPKAVRITSGYALPLASKEHGALLRLLDEYLGRDIPDEAARQAFPQQVQLLRAIRNKLKRPA